VRFYTPHDPHPAQRPISLSAAGVFQYLKMGQNAASAASGLFVRCRAETKWDVETGTQLARIGLIRSIVGFNKVKRGA